MAKTKKVKGLKKYSRFGIAKFLVMAMVLGGGLIYGTKIVQKNQENRSKADEITITYTATANEYSGGTKEDCSKIGGKCGNFTIVYKDGTTCKVGSVSGIIYSSKCDGQKRIKCCAPSSSSTQPTLTTKKSYTAKEFALGTNKKCSSIGGKCGDFDEVPPASASCTVDSVTGVINKGKCDGDSTVQCCASKSTSSTPTPTLKPTTKPSPTPTKAKVRVDGFCSTKKDKCLKGNFKDGIDSKTYYLWQCVGENGGVTKNCKIKK